MGLSACSHIFLAFDFTSASRSAQSQAAIRTKQQQQPRDDNRRAGAHQLIKSQESAELLIKKLQISIPCAPLQLKNSFRHNLACVCVR